MPKLPEPKYRIDIDYDTDFPVFGGVSDSHTIDFEIRADAEDAYDKLCDNPRVLVCWLRRVHYVEKLEDIYFYDKSERAR